MKNLFMMILAAAAFLSFAADTGAQLREPEPQLYDNQYLKKAGAAQAQADVQNCKAKGWDYVNRKSRSGDTLKQGARNAARGAALGAVGGAVMGKNVGRSTGAGAAIGGTSTVLNKVEERGARNPVFQQYVSTCLEDMGYKVIEWR